MNTKKLSFMARAIARIQRVQRAATQAFLAGDTLRAGRLNHLAHHMGHHFEHIH